MLDFVMHGIDQHEITECISSFQK